MSSPMPSSSASATMLTARALLAAGLNVTSTATPALSGVYGCDRDMSWNALSAECASLALNADTFVDGSTTVNWPDRAGAGHSFSAAQFKTLANAINLFTVQCYQYAMGVTTTAPSGNATIP